MNTINSEIYIKSPLDYDERCDADAIYIEREWDSWRLTDDYSEIGKSIMAEFSNYYGLWVADMFNADGEFILK